MRLDVGIQKPSRLRYTFMARENTNRRRTEIRKYFLGDKLAVMNKKKEEKNNNTQLDMMMAACESILVEKLYHVATKHHF